MAGENNDRGIRHMIRGSVLYRQSVRRWGGRLGRLLGICLLGAGIFRFHNHIYNELYREKEKYRYYYNLMVQWKRDGDERIRAFCHRNQIRTAAIYGMGPMGELLYERLLEEGIRVLYAADQNPLLKKAFRVIRRQEIREQEQVDVIIVTTCFYDHEIASELLGDGVEIPILSLEELLG